MTTTSDDHDAIVHRRSYAIVPTELIRDRTLTADARWLMTVCLDRPEQWRFRSDDMAARTGMGRDRVRRARRELLERGWLVAERYQCPNSGQWSQRTHILDRPLLATKTHTAVERVHAMAAEYGRQCAGQGELDLHDGDDPEPQPAPVRPLEPPAEPGDEPDAERIRPAAVDNPPPGDYPSSPRADQQEHRVSAGQPGDCLTGAGEPGPIAITDRQIIARERAREEPGYAAPEVARRYCDEIRSQPWFRGHRSQPSGSASGAHSRARQASSAAVKG